MMNMLARVMMTTMGSLMVFVSRNASVLSSVMGGMGTGHAHPCQAQGSCALNLEVAHTLTQPCLPGVTSGGTG